LDGLVPERDVTGSASELLDALEGTHRRSPGERFGAAFRTFWIALAVGSILLTLLIMAVSGLRLATWAAAAESTPYRISVDLLVLAALLLSVRSATTYHVLTMGTVCECWGRDWRGWSVDRSAITAARLKKGMLAPYVELSLSDGTSRMIPLSRSMNQALRAHAPHLLDGPTVEWGPPQRSGEKRV
jgi:hypothetical protein